MGVIEAILALVGTVGLFAIGVEWLGSFWAVPPPEDAAAPYRDGLEAALRIELAAEDLERQIHAEAVRQAGGNEPSSPWYW